MLTLTEPFAESSRLQPESLFSYRRTSGIGIAALRGPSIQPRQAERLRELLLDLIPVLNGRMVLDASKIESFSCAFLRAVCDATERCRFVGGDLVITGLSEQAKKLLRKTGLSDRLTLATGQPEAMAALGAPMIAPWRLTIARILDIPVASHQPFEPVRAAA